jgi:hypothetical protein
MRGAWMEKHQPASQPLRREKKQQTRARDRKDRVELLHKARWRITVGVTAPSPPLLHAQRRHGLMDN